MDFLVHAVSPSANPTVHPVKKSNEPVSSTDNHPFVSEGYVSLSENGGTVAVKILHDTGANQSYLAANTLPTGIPPI